MNKETKYSLNRIKTGIEGFEYISNGGLPKGRITIVSGKAGTAKTVFCTQFLAEGIRKFNEKGVFVTFEESPDQITENAKSFGWEIEKWIKEKKWAFVDCSFNFDSETIEAGEYDLEAILARIKYGVSKVEAQRIVIDSIGALFSQFSDPTLVRREILRIGKELREMNLTPVITVEDQENPEKISRFGVEEFVADNVVIVRNTLEKNSRRRTIEILKLRGANHKSGEFPFSISSKDAISIIPLSSINIEQELAEEKICFGIETLDEMLDGGIYPDSTILLSGATGTGKTLITTHYASALEENDKSMIFAFEESMKQIQRNAKSWGIELTDLIEEKRLKIISVYPETLTLEDHLIKIKKEINEFQPKKIVIDSLTALKRISSKKSFQEFTIALIAFLKAKQISGIFTLTPSGLFQVKTITEEQVSTMSDIIIVLRYVEEESQLKRGISIIKQRGSKHDPHVREYFITNNGIEIKDPFENAGRILSRGY